MARGPIGIVLSHLSVLKDALDSNYATIWVMEDDIEIVDNPHKISDLITKLDQTVGKDNWDILFTDRNSRGANGNEIPAAGMAKRPNFNPTDTRQYYVNKPINNEFTQIGARFGAYSMIVKRSGMEKIIHFINTHSIFLPYDMDFYLVPGLKMYAVRNNIVTNTLKAISDNGNPTYLNK